MTTSDEIGQIISDIISETDQFYHVYGKALAAWGEIEYGLSLWFQVCTRLEYNMAQNLFFRGEVSQLGQICFSPPWKRRT